MEVLRVFLLENMVFVVIFLLLFLIGNIVMTLISLIKFKKTRKKMKDLLRGKGGHELEELLLQNNAVTSELVKRTDRMMEDITGINLRMKICFQRQHLVRYNAFSDMGGELSFSYALLDDSNDGIIISAITGREDCRVYAKEIKGGRCVTALSAEEKQAIEGAQRV